MQNSSLATLRCIRLLALVISGARLFNARWSGIEQSRTRYHQRLSDLSTITIQASSKDSTQIDHSVIDRVTQPRWRCAIMNRYDVPDGEID